MCQYTATQLSFVFAQLAHFSTVIPHSVTPDQANPPKPNSWKLLQQNFYMLRFAQKQHQSTKQSTQITSKCAVSK